LKCELAFDPCCINDHPIIKMVCSEVMGLHKRKDECRCRFPKWKMKKGRGLGVGRSNGVEVCGENCINSPRSIIDHRLLSIAREPVIIER
jgi:hypothetical protein